MMSAVDEGFMTPGVDAAGFFAFGISLLSFMATGLGSHCRLASELWKKYKVGATKLLKESVGAQLILTVVTIIVKVAAFITCMYLFLYYFSLHIAMYGW